MKRYFVVYDLKDNIICYLHNDFELSNLINIPIWRINLRFKHKNFITRFIGDEIYRIYKFCED